MFDCSVSSENIVETMRKIDILNFITDFRKSPNDIKTYAQVIAHLGTDKESAIGQMLSELQQAKVVREVELEGQRAYQVIAR